VTVAYGDILRPFLLSGGALRGRLVRLGPALDAIVGEHHYPEPVAKCLAEAVSMAALLAGALKFDGVFTRQVQSEGPLSLIVADVTSAGDLRAYARFDADTAEESLLGKGFLALTVDQGPETDRYQGIVELEGGSIVASATRYFEQSEQLATAFKLAVRPPGATGGWRAAAITVQRMPDDPARPGLSGEDGDESLRRAAILMGSVRDSELFDPTLTPPHLLRRLFHGEGLALFDERDLRAACRCSAQRVERTLASFPRPEIEEMKDDSGRVVVTCEFCRSRYVFADSDIDRLYAS